MEKPLEELNSTDRDQDRLICGPWEQPLELTGDRFHISSEMALRQQRPAVRAESWKRALATQGQLECSMAGRCGWGFQNSLCTQQEQQ